MKMSKIARAMFFATLCVALIGCEILKPTEVGEPEDESALSTAAVTEPSDTDERVPSFSVTLGAKDVKSTSLAITTNPKYGTKEQPVLIWGEMGPSATNYVAFEVAVDEKGQYELYATLASHEKRPFAVYVNSDKAIDSTGGEVTGGYSVSSAKKALLGVIELKKGTNEIRLERLRGHFPCLVSISVQK